MDYLTLLTRQPTDTSVVARRLFQGGAYLTNKTLAEATNNDDFMTVENVIGDPDTGARVTPFQTLDVMLQTCTVKHPYVEESGKFLKGIQNAMAIPIKHILKEPPYANRVDNGAAINSMRSQIKFGFDPFTEVCKNCCACHSVMYSFFKSSLMTLREKVKEWGPQQLEQDGQEMALCNIINIMGQVCAIVQEAKHATVDPYTKRKGGSGSGSGSSSNTKAAASCSRCEQKGCKSDIVSFFIKGADEIQERDCISAINKLRASAPSTTKPPPEFLVKDVIGNNSASKRIKLDDAVLCPNMPATSSNVQAAITRLAKNKIVTRERKTRLIKGATLVLDQLQKEQEQEAAEAATTAAEGQQGQGQPPANAIEAADVPSTTTTTATASSLNGTPSIASNIATEASSGTSSTFTITSSTTSTTDPSKEGEGIDLDSSLVLNSFLHAPLSPLLSPVRGDGGTPPLAPTEEQVKELAPETALEEAYGLTPGTEQIRRRDKSNVRSMAEYAKGGTGINTGKYRTFNASLGT